MSDNVSIRSFDTSWTDDIRGSGTETEAGSWVAGKQVDAYMVDLRDEPRAQARASRDAISLDDPLKKSAVPLTLSYPAALPDGYLDRDRSYNYFRT